MTFKLTYFQEVIPSSDSSIGMKKIFVALDNQTASEIEHFVTEFRDDVMFKVNDAFTKYGPEIIKSITGLGGKVFLDLKWHDIPNTVANYMHIAADLRVFCCTIHCLGGFEMMKIASEELKTYCNEKNINPRPKILGITILTSMNDGSLYTDLSMMGSDKTLATMVCYLARKAQDAGLDGVVCSPWEIEEVKKVCGNDFLTVTPGIRPQWSCNDDQKRVMTPKEAIERGADYLVIGRPIMQSYKYGLTKREAISHIKNEIENNVVEEAYLAE